MFSAPSLSCQSSSLHTQLHNTWFIKLNSFWYWVILPQEGENKIYCIYETLPVSFIRGRNIWRMSPLAHLQYSYEKQRVNSEYAWRSRYAHDLPCLLGRVAKVVCVWECLQAVVDFYRPLNWKIGKDPILWCKWTCIPQ